MNQALAKFLLMSCVILSVPSFAEDESNADFNALEAATTEGSGEDLQSNLDTSLDIPPETMPMESDMAAADTGDLEAGIVAADDENPNANAPQPLDDSLETVVDSRRDVTDSGYEPVGPEVGLDGRPVNAAVKSIRELDTNIPGARWSVGIGFQHFVKRDLYLQANIERLFLPKISVGLLGTTLGSTGGPANGDGTLGSVEGTQGFITVNLHSERQFRGLWFQGRGGVTLFKGFSEELDMNFVKWLPTVGASVGWRWGIDDSIGRDDDFSVSVNGGFEVWMGRLAEDSGAVAVHPVIRAEVNFGW